ncbi:MAG TPA: C2 domain-containing protein [Polyangiales bacterium]|nr:C2 domain-containing protein [Polyangiales bacterium]
MAWLLSVLLLLAACGQKADGELTAAQCGNKVDDDADHMTDCEDPDCWVYCPPRNALQWGDASSSQPDAEMPDAAAPKPTPDAGKPPSGRDDDAGSVKPDPSEDAGTVKCDCAPNEICVDDECRPKPTIDGMYTLSVRSAFVPLYDARDRCYDYAVSVGSCDMRIPLICECVRPDPYVVVLLNGKALSGATTASIDGTASPVWPDAPKVQIALKEGDTLTFVVYDYDGLGQDREIFRCSPDLATLLDGAQSLSCSPPSGMTMSPPRGANFAVTVEVSKAGPQ